MTYYLFIIAPVLLQIVCIIHAARAGRIFPWIFIIFFLPGIGSAAYIAVEIIPAMIGARGVRKLATNAVDIVDPGRGLRKEMREVDLTGSIDTRKRLAEEYVRRGDYAGAVALYESMLDGQFRDDPGLLLRLARARFLNGDGAGAQAALDALQAADPKFQSNDAHLLYARALEMQGRDGEALVEYRKLVPVFSGEEARCRYAMLLAKTGARELARENFAQIVKSLDGAPRHYRKAQKEWGDIAKSQPSP
jgi:hypothetical protein